MAEHTHIPVKGPDAPVIIPTPETAERMTTACAKFLETLTSDFRTKAEVPFEESERLRWHFLPTEMWDRTGVSIKKMNEKSREAAFNLLKCGLSEKGYQKVIAIMDLEATLGKIEQEMGAAHFNRHPELYFFTIFGYPAGNKPWGWRVEGHHLSLNFTIVDGSLIMPTPSSFGANPAEVREGPKKGLRILSAEEDLARQLLDSLNTDQKNEAIISSQAPDNILPPEASKSGKSEREGLAARSMTQQQREVLVKLICEYVDYMPAEMAKAEMQRVHDANIDDMYFAWAGDEQRGSPHYYSVHGPFFIVEYNNTQNNANHIHSIWQHLSNNFGADQLGLT